MMNGTGAAAGYLRGRRLILVGGSSVVPTSKKIRLDAAIAAKAIRTDAVEGEPY